MLKTTITTKTTHTLSNKPTKHESQSAVCPTKSVLCKSMSISYRAELHTFDKIRKKTKNTTKNTLCS